MLSAFKGIVAALFSAVFGLTTWAEPADELLGSALLQEALAAKADAVSEISNDRYVSVIDYRAPSNVPRFFLIDTADMSAEVFLVAHGRGSDPPTERTKAAALSIRVHGEGTDGLQYHWSDSLVLEPPSSGQITEQLLGRTHRRGVAFPTVRWDFLCPTWVGAAAMDEALKRTEFMETTSTSLKLRVCDEETPLRSGPEVG